MRPASTRTRVWWEMVGWLLPRGSCRWQLQTSPWAATIDSSRRRTGSPSAANTDASAAESVSDRGTSVMGGPHSASSASGRVVVARASAMRPPIDNHRYEIDTCRIDVNQSTGGPAGSHVQIPASPVPILAPSGAGPDMVSGWERDGRGSMAAPGGGAGGQRVPGRDRDRVG